MCKEIQTCISVGIFLRGQDKKGAVPLVRITSKYLTYVKDDAWSNWQS